MCTHEYKVIQQTEVDWFMYVNWGTLGGSTQKLLVHVEPSITSVEFETLTNEFLNEGSTNLALGKNVMASAAIDDVEHGRSYAVDGIISYGNYYHSNVTEGAFLTVDLGEIYRIDSLEIHRGDNITEDGTGGSQGDQIWMDGFMLYVQDDLDSEALVNYSYSDWGAELQVYKKDISGGVLGRYVTVKISDHYLGIGELKVLGQLKLYDIKEGSAFGTDYKQFVVESNDYTLVKALKEHPQVFGVEKVGLDALISDIYDTDLTLPSTPLKALQTNRGYGNINYKKEIVDQGEKESHQLSITNSTDSGLRVYQKKGLSKADELYRVDNYLFGPVSDVSYSITDGGLNTTTKLHGEFGLSFLSADWGISFLNADFGQSWLNS
eukprot:Awhi_evm2s7294